jgi:hypothetical protein
MSSEPANSTSAATAERRPAIWPWLVVPLLALALFFALSRFKESRLPPAPGDGTAAPAEQTAPSADPS